MEFTQKPMTTFVGGLVTEVSSLEFPPNASVDELNCDLKRDGSRRRRLGMELETGYEMSTQTATSSSTFSLGSWDNVGEQAGVEFAVVQKDSYLLFYKQTTDSALSSNQVNTSYTSGVPYELDMSVFESPAGRGAGFSTVRLASVKGALVVASPDINTFYIERNVDTGEFTATEIDFKIRDFEYVGNTEDYLSKGSINSARDYDTKNCGWVDSDAGDPLSEYRSATSDDYPPLTYPWYAGKSSSGNFSASEWKKVFTGTTLITNGHFIFDLYNKERSQYIYDGDTSYDSVEDSRFSCVASYAGRAFYSGMSSSTSDNGSRVFFTQLLEFGFNNLGKLYSTNDPTSEYSSDLLDTDGGYVTIPEAYNITELHVFGPSLYVFAENGVWKISGIDDVFRATEYSVSKISEDGLTDIGSFVNARGRPYWWSTSGIFTFTVNDLGEIKPQNLSATTIQNYWETSTSSVTETTQSVYDEGNNRVIWMYQNQNEDSENKLNKFLIFDEVIQAFFPWEIVDKTEDTPYIVGAIYDSGVTSSNVDYSLVDNSNNDIVDSSSDPVVITKLDRRLADSKVKYLTLDSSTGAFTFSEATSTTFKDWGGEYFDSYVTGAYDFSGDLETRKATTYLTCFCGLTETGWEVNEDATGYNPVRPSSLLVESYWDFSSVPSASSQQAYRYRYPLIVDESDLNTFDYPESVIITRLKMRGRGRVGQFKFSSEDGKDFHILGYNLITTRVGRF